MSANIESLVAENARTWSDELRAARNMPRNVAATSRLKSDPDKLAKLAELAEIDPEQLADVSVRGTNVSFQVADSKGVLSAGFFPLARLDEGGGRRRKTGKGGVRQTRTPDASAGHGTAPAPSVATTDDPKTSKEAEKGTPPDAEGVPPDIGTMSAGAVAELLKDTPDGVDVGEVLKAEWERPEGPRTVVERAAKKLNLLDEDGKPKTTEAAPPA